MAQTMTSFPPEFYEDMTYGVFEAFFLNFFDASRLPLIVFVLICSQIFGFIFYRVAKRPLFLNLAPPMWQFISSLLGKTGDRLDSDKRPRADLVFRGFIVTAFSLFIIGGGFALLKLFLSHVIPLPVFDMCILFLCIGGGSLQAHLNDLHHDVQEKKKTKSLYLVLSRTLRRNLVMSDAHALTRSALEWSAYGLCRALVLPLTLYWAGGIMLTLIYSVCAGLYWRFGYQGSGSGFALFPAFLERLLGIIPSFLCTFILILSAWVTPKANTQSGISSLSARKGTAVAGQGGLALTVLSRILDGTLGGSVQDISGKKMKAPWIGDEGVSAKLPVTKLKMMIYLLVVANLVFTVFCAFVYIIQV